MEKIIYLRESIVTICDDFLHNNNKEIALTKLKENLAKVKELEYDNCSVELFEVLLDEELLLDILINKDNLDVETFKEVIDNKDSYIQGTHTFKKFIDGLI
ncbi:MAG: hypothetical protein ACRDDY_00480 [Clostridium sp.]|uniref:hypothetical protein n=1 Tax=Clostridium sp. TaxID=1506 RepID=UPI003EE57B89